MVDSAGDNAEKKTASRSDFILSPIYSGLRAIKSTEMRYELIRHGNLVDACFCVPADDFVLELAVESECDYIVTHNVKDFKNTMKFKIQAITPQELLRKIGEIS